MTWIAAWAWARANWRALAGAAAGAALAALPAYWLGHAAGANAVRREAPAAALKAAERNLAAHDAAADQRQADTARVAQQTKELTDAVAKAPDGEPDAARRALNCERLRRAAPAAGLPAGCRP